MEKTWLSNYPAQIPADINADEYPSLVELFEKYAEKYKNRTAFSSFGTQLTFQELEEKSRAVAAYFQQQLGLQKGERVAVMLPNLLQYPVVLFGLLRAGLVVVNVNPLYTPRELKHQLNDSKSVAIIVVVNFAHALAEALPETNIKHVIVSEIGDLLGYWKGTFVDFMLKYVKKKVPAYLIPSAISFKEVLSSGKKIKFNPVKMTGGDMAFLQYTGGTTGIAKGAILSHRNMVANVLQCMAWVEPMVRREHEVAVGALPFYHIFALTVCGLCFPFLGVECLLITNPRNLDILLKILKKNPPTIFVGVNTLFNSLLHHPDFAKLDFSKKILTIAGGMSVQQSVAEKWQEITGSPIIEGYGLTEASPVVSINPLDANHFNGSVGFPVPSTEISVRDDNNQELPIGGIGELWVRGPQIMSGYWNNPIETNDVLDADGWLRTGDIVRVDETGFIYIVDRKKDMILVSGFNVYPAEIEEVIMFNPGVKEVAVIGIPDEKSGEAVKAFIVKKDANLSAAEIITYCHKNLTNYKVPKFIEFRDELPKSNVGKVLRRELRAEEMRGKVLPA